MKPETFFENFGHLADAPNGIKKLRELILQLAVQGKLGTQDQNDEPAAKLLEKIEAERRKLIKGGKIRKDKGLPPVSSADVPYALPESWLWVRLGNVVEYNSGTKVPSSKIAANAWLLELEDIEKDTSRIIQRVTYEERASKSTKAQFAKGDVLYGKLRPYLNKVVVADEDGYCTTEIVPLKIYYGIEPKYLMHALKRPDFLEYVNSKSYGVKMPRLGTDDALQALLPLPPIPEQKRIVEKIRSMMAVCDELEVQQKKRHETRLHLNNSAIDKLLTSQTAKEFTANWQRICDNFGLLYDHPDIVDNLRQAILQLAVQGKLVPQNPKDEPAQSLFEKLKAEQSESTKLRKTKNPSVAEDSTGEMPFCLPSGWMWVQVRDLGITQTGSTPDTSKREYYGSDYPFVTPANIERNCVKYDEDGLSKAGFEAGRRIEPGSILMVCIGGSIGKVNYVDRVCSCNQQINVLTPFSELDAKLIVFFMRSPYFQNAVISTAPQTTLPILSKGKWEFLFFPLPPLSEQKRIIAKVDQLMALCDQLQTQLKEAQETSVKLTAAAVANLTASA